MGRRKKASSVRSQKELDDLFGESFIATKAAIDRINQRLKEGKGLTDEMFRFLKRAPELISTYKAREQAKEERQESLSEGKLKEFVERLWRLREIGPLSLVIEATNYYRCEECGELHKLGEECIFKQYQAISQEPTDQA